MSYENPQTVIDTESAKYYAQAISNLGLTAAKMIDAETERKRKEALDNKKRNITNSKNRTKYNSEYIEIIDKSLMDAGPINLKPQLRSLLNNKVNEAVDLKIKLDNFTGDPNKRMELQNELNSLETLFKSNLEEALTAFETQVQSISELSANGGKEGGLSYSHNNSYMIEDVLSTQVGQKSKNANLDIEKIDGSYNLLLKFGEEKGIVDIDAFGNEYQTGKKSRSYNLNKDFVDGDIIVNPNVTESVQKTLQDLGYVKNGDIDLKGPITAVYSDKIKEKTIGDKTFYYPQVDGQLLYNKLKPKIEANIGGIVKQGRFSDGDQAYGLIALQSFVDDILPDEIDASIGILEPDPTTVSGINQEQFEKIALYLSSVQQANLNVKMPPDKDLIPEKETDIIEDTAAIRTAKFKKEELNKLIISAGKKLEKDVIPTFESLDDPNVNNLINYIEEIDGIKSVDFSKELAKGDKPSFKVIGPAKTVTIDSGMSQTQIKKRLLKSLGATDDQVKKIDFTKTSGKFKVASNVMDIPNEFDIFKRTN